MREDLCTIPVSEVFEPADGCPICRMRDTIEERMLDYIMGAAMMEPDVRQETNRKGFCTDHFDRMLSHKGRLSLALMLDSHLQQVSGSISLKGGLLKPPPAKRAGGAIRMEESCFVCEKIEWGMARMLDTVYRLYETESDFRRLFDRQPMFCLPHYNRLMAGCDKKIMKQHWEEFADSLGRITKAYAESLTADIQKYCRMYDYRSSTGEVDWGNSKDSVQRAIGFLTSRTPK